MRCMELRIKQHTGLITQTLGPSNDFTLLNGCIGKCVGLSRLLVGFRMHFKSLHFHSFIHSYQITSLHHITLHPSEHWQYGTLIQKRLRQTTHLSWSLYCYKISEDFLSLCHKSVIFQCPIVLAGDPKLEIFVAVFAAQEVAEQRKTT